MEARINVNPETIVVIPGKVYSMADIARIAGTTYSTARTALVSDSPKVGSNTRSKIRAIAEKVGYSPKRVRQYNYYDGNFGSREEEHQKMRELRRRGYTNPEIAKMIGRHYVTVLNAIGPQPKELTEMSFALAGERIVRRNRARKEVLLKQKISAFQSAQKEYDAGLLQAQHLEAESARIMAEAQRIADEAKAKRNQLEEKVIELSVFRKEAEKAAKALGRNLA